MSELRKNENEFLDVMPEEECADRSERRKRIENGAELEQPVIDFEVSNIQQRCPMCGREYPPNLFQRHNCPAVYESVRRRGGGPMGV